MHLARNLPLTERHISTSTAGGLLGLRGEGARLILRGNLTFFADLVLTLRADLFLALA